MEIVNELENILLDHCYDMTILKKDSNIKKKDSIIDSLIGAIVRYHGELTPKTVNNVQNFITDIQKDRVLDLTFFENGGNVTDYINPKWEGFAKSLWRIRPVGLGSPNSASGEAELMFIFISPRIEKAVKGDILIDGVNIELKGEEVRLNGKVTGNEFRRRTIKLAHKYNLKPNLSKRVKKPAVEMEKPAHQKYWQEEIMKLELRERKNFTADFLTAMDDEPHSVDHLFDVAYLDFDKLRKEIVKSLYSYMIKDRLFDKMVILGDGTNSFVINNDRKKFNEMVDDNTIPLMSDYFRINHDAKIGWYIS